MPRPTAKPAAAQGAPATIQCFKPGRHTDMRGTVLAFAERDLAASAEAYDPALWRAPLVVGHPITDAPAWGHVAALAYSERALEATPELVNAEFAAQVAAQAYTSVSACFWRPDAPSNPVPGVYYLRHVGFLGAVPPAILGMRAPTFAADQLARYAAAADDLVEFSAWDDVDNASLWRGLRDWLLGKFGQAEADTALPGWLVAGVERGAQAEVLADQAGASTESTQTGAPALTFAAGGSRILETPAVTEAEKLALQAENTRLKQQITDSAAAAQTAALAAARADGLVFADSLVAQDRLATDRRDAVGELFAALATVEQAQGAVVQYGAADARAPLLPVVKQLLSELPVRVAQGRLATAGRAAGASGVVGFAAPGGAQVDPASLAVHHRVQAYQRAHAGVAYQAALDAVLAGAA